LAVAVMVLLGPRSGFDRDAHACTRPSPQICVQITPWLHYQHRLLVDGEISLIGFLISGAKAAGERERIVRGDGHPE
jgi:hypothetical protein